MASFGRASIQAILDLAAVLLRAYSEGESAYIAEICGVPCDQMTVKRPNCPFNI